MRKILLIAENLRSANNVGSLLRTADGLGISHVYLTGYTPHPPVDGDPRPAHESAKVLSQIRKTSLGAEDSVSWSHVPDINTLLDELKEKRYCLAGLEQSDRSVVLTDFTGPPPRIALVVGNEVSGISQSTLELCDVLLEIPMKGAKESFNVSVAAAIAAHYLSL